MTRTLFVLLVICYMSTAEYSAKCSEDSQNGLTLKPTNDGVEGRYLLTWCTKANRNVTKWELVMKYQERPAQELCPKYKYGIPVKPVHSYFEEIIKLDLNCTNVCFSTNLDLIFNSTCYYIQSKLYEGYKSSTPINSLQYIINHYPKEHFTQSQAVCSPLSNGEELVVHWYLGYIPATDYTMQLCNSSATHASQCENISPACRTVGAAQSEVRCALAAPFGCYDVALHHRAPWTSAVALFGPLITTYHKACHTAARAPEPHRAARGSLWLALGLAAALLLVTLVLLRALCRREDGARAARVLRRWLDADDRTESEPVIKAAAGKEPGARPQVVLLYARDCPQLSRAAALLRALLAERAGCAVVDLYQPSTIREAARAPAEWLQRALSADGSRVVLLQSPAAACLHAARHDLSAPAHGRRVLYREPQAGDWLLTLALRRLAETGHVGLPYRKYFVAGFTGIEAEVLPNLTPQRRYELPAAADLLLADVAACCAAPHGAPPRSTAQRSTAQHDTAQHDTAQHDTAQHGGEQRGAAEALRCAAEEYVSYVRDNPDYVEDLFYMQHG